MSYTVYDKADGTILKTVVCSPEAITLQYDPDTSAHIEGEYDKALYKIEQGKAKLKSESEQADYRYSLIKDTIPPIDPALTDTELDAYIDQYFYGRVDVHQWKKDHYRILRIRHYPPVVDFIDAQVKIADPAQKAAGEAQMAQYVNKCLAVKQRFPKPVAKEQL